MVWATARAPLRLRMSRWVIRLAAIDRVEHGLGVVAEVERDRGDPHGRADAGRRLAGQARGDAALQGGQHLAKTPADAPVGADERTLRRRQAQVEFGEPLLIDPAVVEQDVAERQGLLGVVGVEAAQPPAVRLPLPRLDSVDVILHPSVVRLDLLGAQALEGGAQGVTHGQSQQAPSNTVNSRQMRHRGSAPRMPNRTPGSRGRFRLDQTNRKIPTWPYHANRNLSAGPTISGSRRRHGTTDARSRHHLGSTAATIHFFRLFHRFLPVAQPWPRRHSAPLISA